MFFSNATLFRFPRAIAPTFDALESHLAECALKPVGPTELERHGFVPPMGEGATALHARQGDALWITLGTEFRVLPPGVVERELATKLKEVEAQEGRALGSRARKRLKEEIVLSLLPRSFVQRRRVNAVLLLDLGLMLVDTASRKQADTVASELRKAMGSFPAVPINAEVSPRAVLTSWIAGEPMPDGVEMAEECELKESLAKGAVIRCQRQDLRSDEVTRLLEAGKQATRLGITWQDRVSLVVDEGVTLRKLRLLDIATQSLEVESESREQHLDAQFALFAGEMRALFGMISSVFMLSAAEPLFEPA